MKMSRESRKLFNELDRLSQADGINGLITPGHIYICDMITTEYITAPMINIIKTRLKKIVKSKREWKHYTVEYWEPVLRSMLSHNGSAKRETDYQSMKPTSDYTAFHYIIDSFLLTDYSLSDAILLNVMVNTYKYDDIVHACQTAKQMKVYEIRYINAILEKEYARKQQEIDAINKLTTRIEKSNTILEKPMHVHSVLDVASSQYEYEQKMANAELERKFMELVGGKI